MTKEFQELKIEKHVLAGMAPAKGKAFNPVHVQKLFFVLDERGEGPFLAGQRFNFQPYDYGPYDRTVYQVIESLRDQGLAKVNEDASGIRKFPLTPEGQEKGDVVLASLDEKSREFIVRVSNWIRSQDFTDLLSVIY